MPEKTWFKKSDIKHLPPYHWILFKCAKGSPAFCNGGIIRNNQHDKIFFYDMLLLFCSFKKLNRVCAHLPLFFQSGWDLGGWKMWFCNAELYSTSLRSQSFDSIACIQLGWWKNSLQRIKRKPEWPRNNLIKFYSRIVTTAKAPL